MSIVASLLTAVVLVSSPLPGVAQPAEQPSAARRTADRPTALPEDKDLANQFARAAAGYTTQVRILEAAGRDVAAPRAMANWFYFNAIDLSDEAFARARFSAHYTELSDLNAAANRAVASGQAEQRASALKALFGRLTEWLAEGERLHRQYEKTFNTVTQNPHGSFKIETR